MRSSDCPSALPALAFRPWRVPGRRARHVAPLVQQPNEVEEFQAGIQALSWDQPLYLVGERLLDWVLGGLAVEPRAPISSTKVVQVSHQQLGLQGSSTETRLTRSPFQ